MCTPYAVTFDSFLSDILENNSNHRIDPQRIQVPLPACPCPKSTLILSPQNGFEKSLHRLTCRASGRVYREVHLLLSTLGSTLSLS